jgi:hypothetical protein
MRLVRETERPPLRIGPPLLEPGLRVAHKGRGCGASDLDAGLEVEVVEVAAGEVGGTREDALLAIGGPETQVLAVAGPTRTPGAPVNSRARLALGRSPAADGYLMG